MNEFDLDRFRADGVVAIRQAFSADEARKMGDTIWRRVEAHSAVRRDDPRSWRDATLPSFKPIKQRPVFRAVTESAAVAAALDGIFGAGHWTTSHSGVQVLMTLPNSATWTLPDHLWHMDAGFGRTVPTNMVKVFCCVDDVRPGGGGTLALAGSPRLVDRDSNGLQGGNTASWRRFLKRYDWTHELIKPGDEPARTERLMTEAGNVDGIELRVVEMTGEPGDVYVTDIHTFHCVAPNAQDRPRMMLAAVFRRV